MRQDDPNTQKLVDYYRNFNERERLSSRWGQLEFVRTTDILRRYLPKPPAVILDIGGASGRYACWLARHGYDVSIIDPVPLHIQQAKEASAKQPEHPITRCVVGDARQLDDQDATADAILLMGPLYHLVDAEDRRKACRESYRVLKSNGHLFAVGISRFSSMLEGFSSDYIHDPELKRIMEQDLHDGHHRNPTRHPLYFTDTFFHHPEELQREVEDAGFGHQATLAIEGISYVMKDFDTNWEDEATREFLLKILRTIEKEPSLLGASPHMMCVAVKR